MRQNKIKVIGLAGGAGSGKSLIAAALSKKYRVQHINTDEIAKGQMQQGGISYKAVVDAFGSSILKADGEINRGQLADIVFRDSKKLKLLNSITHANVTRVVEATINELKQSSDTEIILVETAILFEVGYDKLCDEVWYVYASEDTRKKRLMEKRGYSEERVNNIFSSQMTEEMLRLRSDRVIANDCDNENEAEAAILKLFEKEDFLEYNA